jgi:hypothetical protein
MDKGRKGVHTETVFELIQLDDRSVPVDVNLDYDPGEPHAVQLTLALLGGDPVTWLVGRELLSKGLATRAGDGDIHIEPLSERTALMEFRSADGEAWFRIPVVEIAEFLHDTYEVIPQNRESEWLDVDGAVIRLVAQDADFGEAKRKDR